MADTVDAPAKVPKKKKTLAFLKSAPKPGSTTNTERRGFDKGDEDDDALDLFRRSKDFFPVVVEEQQSPRETTPGKKDDIGIHEPVGATQSPSPRSAKRRKLSSSVRTEKSWESPEDLYGPATPPRRVSKSLSATPHRSNKKRATPSSAKSGGRESAQSAQSEDPLPTPSRSNSHRPFEDEDGVIALDDDLEHDTRSENVIATRSSTRDCGDESMSSDNEDSKPDSITLEDSEDDLLEGPSSPKEDEQFAHFVQRAKQREAAAKAEAEAAAAARTPDVAGTPDGTTSKKREPMIEVKIFVCSRMSQYPDVGSFGAKRGLHQNLGVIRRTYITWMKSKGAKISEKDESGIFLTWRGRRIYDVSTGISLGWDPVGSGGFRTASRTSGFTQGGILLEAWTQEDLDNELAAQEIQKRIDRGELVDDFSDEEDEEPQPEAEKIRISLKEKDQEPVKMSVHGDFEIRLIVGAYRKMKKIPDDREIKLRYEGEWLDGAMTVEQADIEAYCTVEVYIR